MKRRFNDLNSHFRNLYGTRVHKLTIDAGFTCPNRDGSLNVGGCIYCNLKGSGSGAYIKGLSVSQQLAKSRDIAMKRYKTNKFIAYFQSFTNTYADIDLLKKLYDEALAFDGIIGLAIGTRPDCITPDILSLLESYTRDKVIWLEYGLQSSHDASLKRINRGHDVACFLKAIEQTKNRGIKICTHLILGLPHETATHMLQTADFIARLPIDGVKIHLLYVIKNTPLEKLYNSNRFKCLSQSAYIDLVVRFIERLPPNIVIQRLTSDPDPHELVAPAWAMRKQETIQMLIDLLEQRDTWQGKFHKTSAITSSSILT